MANVRACFYFLILLVNYRLVAPEPTFGTKIWCNLFCAEDSEEADDDSYEYYDFFDVCFGCPTKTSTTAAPAAAEAEAEAETAAEDAAPKPVNIIIPPSNGLNMTVSSANGAVLMNFMPWAASAASATTAAPATTAAAAGETTAAAETTTAAATTAAK